MVASACANQQALTGGEKDTTPPRILQSEPLNGAVNYSGNKIVLKFDEFVQLKNPQSEVIISPPLEEFPDMKLSGKKVIISWKEELKPNTTYLVQLGNAIVDNNEGNPLDSNVFVFSTGAVLDSFEVRGKIIDAFSLAPVAGAKVMLYKPEGDSLPLTVRPDYFSRTNEQGEFVIAHLTPGTYKIFALKTDGTGYLYQRPTDPIAFSDRWVRATMPLPDSLQAADTGGLVLRMFVEGDSVQYLKSYSAIEKFGLVFEFNQPVKKLSHFHITGTDTTNWMRLWSNDRDSLTCWFPSVLDYDTIHVVLGFDARVDTIHITPPKSTKKLGKKEKNAVPGEQRLVLRNSLKQKHPHFKTFSLESPTPIREMNATGRAWLIEGRDTLDAANYLTHSTFKVMIDYPWKQDKRYTLVLGKGAVTDRFGRSTDSVSFSFQTTREEDFGQLMVKHRLPDLGSPYLCELFDEKGKVVSRQTIQPAGTLRFPHLKVGKYKLRVILDENRNGTWDTGKYLKHRQPERVVLFDQPIEIRSNWISEFDWTLSPNALAK
ncbi:MAG: Ig-like domain-containing protein [Salibacteraceae bacterium]